jgi:hypothetical protein
MRHQSTLQKMVSPADALRIIEGLKRIKSPDVPIDYLRRQVKLLFKGFAHTSIIILPDWEGKLHRAVPYDVRPNYKKDLWYPPIEKTKLGRANLPNNPMFYCSGDPRAIFFELGLKPGDMVVTSKWIFKDEILVSPLGYSAEAFERLNASRSCPIVVPENERHEREFNHTNIRITKFLHDLFTQKITIGSEYLYKLTAVISEMFFSLQSDCGLVYPTIAMHANAENFVLTPSLVRNRLALESAKWSRVDKVKDFSYTFTPLAYSDSFDSDGRIEWRSVPEQEKRYI